MSAEHDHDHDHDGHSHAEWHTTPPPDIQLRIKAMESLLVEMGVIDPATLDGIVDFYERQVGPRNGARIVARAWADPDFKQRLLADPAAAVAELGMPGISGDHVVMVENTPDAHNMIVCTLCSCYPWQTLGLPPVWFKSASYRSRAVSHPRDVLKEFGVDLPAAMSVKVWDSTADTRYMILPMRPAGTEGLTEDQLADLVTRDSMIGTGLPLGPAR
ncbi:MAG TPA: nitrile hydratase subunit alpha [Alphaproteobacteria bacterium]|jgi:nitrile hydratase|nr:nitrile hydratase subunit alpha [Alphaproteobacteria bacterium]